MIEVIVNLTYFKPSGKYYSDGTFKMAVKNCYELPNKLPYMYDVFEEVRMMAREGNLPGLNPGAWEGVIHVQCAEGLGCPGIVCGENP